MAAISLEECRVLNDLGEYEQAKKMAETLLSSRSDDRHWALVELTKAHNNLGAYKGAEDLLERSLKEQYDLALRVHLTIQHVYCLINQKKMARAEEVSLPYRHDPEVDANFRANLYEGLAFGFLKIKDYHKTMTHAALGIGQKGDDQAHLSNLYRLLGKAYLKLGHDAEAVDAFQQALEIFPKEV